jgi:hypothetical protein
MDSKGQFRTINEKVQFIQEISCGLCMDTNLNFKNMSTCMLWIMMYAYM